MGTYLHGVATTITATGLVGGYGLIQSVEVSASSDIQTATHEAGYVNAYNFYNEVRNVSATIVYESGKPLPAPGDQIVVNDTRNSGDFLVTSVSVSESNAGYTTVSLTGVRYHSAGIPA